jgi:hypothetical protein
MTNSPLLEYRLEHIFSLTTMLLDPPEVIGPVPEGIRINFYVTGGKVTGPKVRGIMRPVGGDWITIRTDGVGIVEARCTIETHDGALIYGAYTGVADLGEDGYEKLLRQEMPPSIQLRVAPRYHTAHPRYYWLNRLQCLAIGQALLESSEVRYDMYALR